MNMTQIGAKAQDDIKRAKAAEALSDSEIIEKIFVASGTEYFNNSENVAKSVAYFSVLISRLSSNSEKLQKRANLLSWAVIFLTIALLLTIPQVNSYVFGSSAVSEQPVESSGK